VLVRTKNGASVFGTIHFDLRRRSRHVGVLPPSDLSAVFVFGRIITADHQAKVHRLLVWTMARTEATTRHGTSRRIAQACGHRMISADVLLLA
jgi:hypothetical protein